MKISNNSLIINLDEAKYLASEPQTWKRDTLKDKKIAVAKAVKELMETVHQTNRNIVWDGHGEF